MDLHCKLTPEAHDGTFNLIDFLNLAPTSIIHIKVSLRTLKVVRHS